tara:strand:+ start:71 stop:571 length:501 start_codon:yes stop_codon:yes gene_type:complete
MYFVDFNPDTNEIQSISPQRQNGFSIEITDELGQKFETGVENFSHWKVVLSEGKYIFQKKVQEKLSNKNIHQIPNLITTNNYIELLQDVNKITIQAVGDKDYLDYLSTNMTRIYIFVTEKNNPYILLNTLQFMLQETSKGLSYTVDSSNISLFMQSPSYTFVHTGK